MIMSHSNLWSLELMILSLVAEITVMFPRVPIPNFTARIIGPQRVLKFQVPIATPTFDDDGLVKDNTILLAQPQNDAVMLTMV